MPITSSHLDPRAMIIPVWMGSLGPLKHFNIASSNKMYNAGNFDADLIVSFDPNLMQRLYEIIFLVMVQHST